MLIINGKEVLKEVTIVDPVIEHHVVTYTADHTVTWDEAGKLLVMNSSSDKVFTLPTPLTSKIGAQFYFANINTGKLTINVAGTNVTIADSTPTTGSISSTDDSYANLTLMLASATMWVLNGGHGTWTTA